MKCPHCQHKTSDKAILQCSHCGEAFERGPLEEYEHLKYLQSWLIDRPEIGIDQRMALLEIASTRQEELLTKLLPQVAPKAPVEKQPTPTVEIAPPAPMAAPAPKPQPTPSPAPAATSKPVTAAVPVAAPAPKPVPAVPAKSVATPKPPAPLKPAARCCARCYISARS